jgi:hypothetical protein
MEHIPSPAAYTVSGLEPTTHGGGIVCGGVCMCACVVRLGLYCIVLDWIGARFSFSMRKLVTVKEGWNDLTGSSSASLCSFHWGFSFIVIDGPGIRGAQFSRLISFCFCTSVSEWVFFVAFHLFSSTVPVLVSGLHIHFPNFYWQFCHYPQLTKLDLRC